MAERLLVPKSHAQFDKFALSSMRVVWSQLASEAARMARGQVISNDKVNVLKDMARSLVHNSRLSDIDINTIPYNSILLNGRLVYVAESAQSIPDLTRLVIPVIAEAGKAGRIDFVGGPITAFGPEHKSASFDALHLSMITLAFESAEWRTGIGKREIMHMSTTYTFNVEGACNARVSIPYAALHASKFAAAFLPDCTSRSAIINPSTRPCLLQTCTSRRPSLCAQRPR